VGDIPIGLSYMKISKPSFFDEGFDKDEKTYSFTRTEKLKHWSVSCKLQAG
jgi:hypothetical protein